MAIETRPKASGNTAADWQVDGLARGPEGPTSGMGVSVVGSSTIRVASGQGMFGGFSLRNTSNADRTVTLNSSGVTRYERLVVRTTISTSGVISQAVDVIGGSSKPTPTQVLGSVWETPLASWTVANGTAIPTGLIPDGYFTGNRRWTKTQVVPPSTSYGTGDLRSSEVAAAAAGPAPAYVSPTPAYEDLIIAVDGVYDIEADIFANETAPSGYLTLPLPDLTLVGAVGAQGWAQVIRLSVPLSAGYVIRPRIQHAEAGSETFTVSVGVSRRR